MQGSHNIVAVQSFPNIISYYVLYVVFSKAMEEKAVDTWVCDLRAAKHRFESSQKPMGRSVLYLEAMLASSSQMYRDRRKVDKVGVAAFTFLNFITEEVVLMIALMADAGDGHGIEDFHEQVVNFYIEALHDFIAEGESLSHVARLVIASQKDNVLREVQFYREKEDAHLNALNASVSLLSSRRSL